MRLLFSEGKADYAHYIFPYAIWAFPEPGEKASDFFKSGFLPSSRELDRFYLCRQVRVNLQKFVPSSENRRILRKGEGIFATLVERSAFDFDAKRREFYKNYADIRFGKDTTSYERLDSLFSAKITSHLLVFSDTGSGKEVGAVTLFLERPAVAYYYYGFYDLNYYGRNLGMFMMTSAVAWFKEQGFEHLYLGSCYSQNALYKTQFLGAEFFNGVRWTENLEELKYLIRRGQGDNSEHLLENREYREEFYKVGLSDIAEDSLFRVKPEGGLR